MSRSERGAQAPADAGGDALGSEAFVEVPRPNMSAVAGALRWKGLTFVVGQGSWYAALLVLAILLPPSAFGIIAIGTAVTTATALLINAGAAGAIIATPQVGAAYIRRALLRTTLVGLALTGLALLLAGPIVNAFAKGANPDVLRVMMLTIAFAAVTIVPNALLQKLMRFKLLAVTVIAGAVIASAAAITAALLGAGVWALVIRLVVNQLVITILVWVYALPLFPRGAGRERANPPRGRATWFLVIATAYFCTLTLDNMIVGHLTDVTQLGLYALAFSLGFAPLRQISWHVGAVLFPSIAATKDPASVERRTMKSLQLMALLLLPMLPPAIALAPGLIPTVLGEEWTGMVIPFQVLLGVGIGQGLINILAETLSVTRVDVRGRIEVVWAAGVLTGVAVGTGLVGIEGAALGHLIAFSGLASAYLWFGTRAIGTSPRRVLQAIRGVVGCVVAQAIATGLLVVGIGAAGGGVLLAGILAAAGGLIVLTPLLWVSQRDVIAELRKFLAAVDPRRRAVPAVPASAAGD
ncbi:MAG: oligosaccharide flippase family protein [Solirubrobacteraceae bacterium]